jgi:hypothetical protein
MANAIKPFPSLILFFGSGYNSVLLLHHAVPHSFGGIRHTVQKFRGKLASFFVN